MATGVVSWSQTAASNATADSSVNWAEGQAPSTVNDSARAMMASVAKYRDDVAGSIVTGGTSTAYTVTSYQGFPTLAAMDGKMVAFSPHTNSGATVTLNVDSLGAKPLRSAPSVEIPANSLISGVPYAAVYNNSAGVWYLFGDNITATGSILTASATNVALAPDVSKSVASLSLPPGDWDVSGSVEFVPDPTTQTSQMISAISTVNNTLPAIPNSGGYTTVYTSLATGGIQCIPVGPMQQNVATTTTVYLVAQMHFSVANLNVNAFFRARRWS